MEIDPTQPNPNSLEAAQGDFESSTTTLAQAGLDRDAFLTIFLAQLENQDPLSPQDASELGAQLATFSQLEQNIVQAEALGGVNDRLDKLIELSGGRTETSLDPVSLIGKTVEVLSDVLAVPTLGESPRLTATVNDANSAFLLVEAFDAQEQSVGVAAIGRSNSEGQPVALAPGAYDLWFEDGRAQVRFPNGEQTAIDFESVTRDEDGNLLIGQGGLVSLPPGQSYRFDARVTGTGPNGPFSRGLSMTAAGNVDGVRIVDGIPVLNISNQQIDPSNIISIR